MRAEELDVIEVIRRPGRGASAVGVWVGEGGDGVCTCPVGGVDPHCVAVDCRWVERRDLG